MKNNHDMRAQTFIPKVRFAVPLEVQMCAFRLENPASIAREK